MKYAIIYLTLGWLVGCGTDDYLKATQPTMIQSPIVRLADSMAPSPSPTPEPSAINTKPFCGNPE